MIDINYCRFECFFLYAVYNFNGLFFNTTDSSAVHSLQSTFSRHVALSRMSRHSCPTDSNPMLFPLFYILFLPPPFPASSSVRLTTLPSHWDPMDSDFSLVDVPEGTAEYNSVVANWDLFCPIVKIKRVQNRYLWLQVH